jgi:hypothetical protein
MHQIKNQIHCVIVSISYKEKDGQPSKPLKIHMKANISILFNDCYYVYIQRPDVTENFAATNSSQFYESRSPRMKGRQKRSEEKNIQKRKRKLK